MLTKYTSIELRNMIHSVANDVRAMFNEANIGYLSVGIDLEGRTTDDLKLSFNVAADQYGDRVHGGDLLACVEECLRRKGWSRLNAPNMLTYAGETKAGEL